MSIAAVMEIPMHVRRYAPLVGYVSKGNTIEVLESHERLIVRLSLGTQLFILLACALFGPVMTLVIWLRPAMPLFVKMLSGALIIAAWILLFYTLFTRPRLEIGRGDIKYFRRGNKATRTIPRDRIAQVTVDEDAYTTGPIRSVNHVVVVHTTDGEAIALCASPNFQLIDSVTRALTKSTDR